MFPQDFNSTIECVNERIVIGKPKSDGAGIESPCETEAIPSDGGRAAQVELNGVVKLIGINAVDLRYVIVAIGREPVADAMDEFEGRKTDFCWENCLKEALTESPYPHH